MSFLGSKLRGVTVLNAVLFGSFVLSSCVVEEKRRRRPDDDCEIDSDCDDDEYCDEDNECARLPSGSGGSGGTSTLPTAGSSSNPSGGTGGGATSSDAAWCAAICEDLTVLCPSLGTYADCVSSCTSGITQARSYGCAAPYQDVYECMAESGACDEATLTAACYDQLVAFTNCLGGGTSN